MGPALRLAGPGFGSVCGSFTAVRNRPPATAATALAQFADGGELGSAVLESVLGATPREFESRILLDAGLRRCEHGAGGQYPPGVLARSQFWSQLRASTRAASESAAAVAHVRLDYWILPRRTSR